MFEAHTAGRMVVEGQQADQTHSVHERGLVHQAEQASTLNWLLAQLEERASNEHLPAQQMEAQESTSMLAKERLVGRASCLFVRVPKAAQGTWAVAQAV